MNFVANLQLNPGAFLFSSGSRGGPAPPLPLYLDQTGDRRAQKIWGGLPPPPTPGPGLLSQGLNPAPLLHDSY